MNIKNKDLNLLLLFKVLYEELNVSSAANRLNLSQPALSHKLNKLRQEFADPLFEGRCDAALCLRIGREICDDLGWQSC